MSYIRETEEYKGYTIEIVSDDDPQDPRGWDNVGRMVTWHRRYNLGDEQPKESPEEWLECMANIDTEVQDYEFSVNDCIRMIEEQGTIIQPLYLYDHSGISISTSSWVGRAPHASWDSGQIGWIYITKEQIEKEWSGDRERAQKYMEGEVETYDQFLTGDVWGWRVVETGESVWGYYGDEGIKDAIAEAKSSIDWECKNAQEEYEKQPKHSHAEMATV